MLFMCRLDRRLVLAFSRLERHIDSTFVHLLVVLGRRLMSRRHRLYCNRVLCRRDLLSLFHGSYSTRILRTQHVLMFRLHGLELRFVLCFFLAQCPLHYLLMLLLLLCKRRIMVRFYLLHHRCMVRLQQSVRALSLHLLPL
jgi:hypothetical protein